MTPSGGKKEPFGTTSPTDMRTKTHFYAFLDLAASTADISASAREVRMTLGNSLFWFGVGFVSTCALGIIVYA